MWGPLVSMRATAQSASLVQLRSISIAAEPSAPRDASLAKSTPVRGEDTDASMAASEASIAVTDAAVVETSLPVLGDRHARSAPR